MDIYLPTWLGSYAGDSYTFEKYEYLTVSKISPASRVAQSDSLKTRWFDYVRLHPMQASYWFAECYRRVFVEKSLKLFGKKSAGFKNDPMMSKEAASIWNLRSYCDTFGYEYMWFVRTMMEYRLTCGDFKNRVPRPCHLLREPDEMTAIDLLWNEKINATAIVLAKDPYFSATNWENSKSQQRYEQFLINQIRKKRIKRFVLADLVYKSEILREAIATAEFQDDMNEVKRDRARLLNDC